MNVTKDHANYTMPCNDCQAGQMHRTYLTYFTWLGDELITVPDFPAWVCDVCGKREFDVHALNQLSLLLKSYCRETGNEDTSFDGASKDQAYSPK